MANTRGAEGPVTGVDQGCKHGEGGSKTAHLVTACEEEHDHTTNTEASENVSAFLLIVLIRSSSLSCPLKSQLDFEQHDQIHALASCKRRSTCAHEPAKSPIIRVSLDGLFFDQIHR
jgi:hypothetical protein